MKKSYRELEIYSYRKYCLYDMNNKKIKAFYWYLKHKYYINKCA